MGIIIYMQLDVLASSPDEINVIENALKNPCAELIAWRAQMCEMEPKDIAEGVKEIVTLNAVHNPRSVHPFVNRAHRFESSWNIKFWGLVFSHIAFVSGDFPNAIFLAEYYDDQEMF